MTEGVAKSKASKRKRKATGGDLGGTKKLQHQKRLDIMNAKVCVCVYVHAHVWVGG